LDRVISAYKEVSSVCSKKARREILVMTLCPNFKLPSFGNETNENSNSPVIALELRSLPQ
jgi:hypothetical protein